MAIEISVISMCKIRWSFVIFHCIDWITELLASWLLERSHKFTTQCNHPNKKQRSQTAQFAAGPSPSTMATGRIFLAVHQPAVLMRLVTTVRVRTTCSWLPGQLSMVQEWGDSWLKTTHTSFSLVSPGFSQVGRTSWYVSWTVEDQFLLLVAHTNLE